MRLIGIFICTIVSVFTAAAQEEYAPRVAEASHEAQLALQGFRLPEGMSGEVAAAEPLVANPVAFFMAHDGRLYVCETFRQEKGVEDNRGHMNWLENDLRLETVEERVAMFRNVLGSDVQRYAQEHDRIRLLTDSDADGVFDSATVFADGFNAIADGTGAGVLEHNGSVYYTCIPNVWKLIDTDGDGSADVRDALHHGYGVRVAFRGHDLHGLTMGPDGRIYFSIGDRGFNVITKEGTRLKRVDTGAVFRCFPDGSHLEVFAYGLRNPQELAFDDDGNLFTGDNNSDGGDQARWVYVVQDGDTGWRMYYQYLSDRGPWNRERMWYPYRADEDTAAVQPACIVPPVANLGDGPSGLTWYPGVGLPERYQQHFFMADFRGSAGNSGIRSFAVSQRGAGWEITDSHEFLRSILATDVDFAPDGSLVVSDWVNGWTGEGKGRIYRFTDDVFLKSGNGRQSQELLAGRIRSSEVDELRGLLSHPDRRVRQEAQFELVRRDAREELLQDALQATDGLRSKHALWGCWQMGLQSSERGLEVLAALRPLLAADVEVSDALREQAIRVIGDLADRHGTFAVPEDMRRRLTSSLIPMLRSDALRIAGFAAVTLGHFGDVETAGPILDVYTRDTTADPVIRHQVTMGLTRLAGRHPGLLKQLTAATAPPSQMPILLAMRRLGDRAIVDFLSSPEAVIVDEAARAIHDEPFDALMSILADHAGDPGLSSATRRRALNACFRAGTAEHAERVARAAADVSLPEDIRLAAAELLRTWNTPSNLNPVTGRWAPLNQRDVTGLAEAVGPQLPTLFAGSRPLRESAIAIAAGLGITDVEPALEKILLDESADASTRAAAFRALGRLTRDMNALIERGLESGVESVRVAALEILVARRPDDAIPLLGDILSTGSVAARQRAVELLARTRRPQAITLLTQAFRALINGDAPVGMALELLAAAEQLNDDALASAAEEFDERRRAAGTPTHLFLECLEGGDADRGYQIFFGRSAASCRRCHKVNGNGGEVGPDLSAIAKDKDRQYLLEAIVDPNAKIAKDFETLVVVTVEGKVLSGIVRSEDDQFVRLVTPEGAVLTIAQNDIEERAKGQSGMPGDMVKNLTRAEIRDLVEYLSTLQTAASTAHGGER